jgi:hypothetical protein
MKIVGIICLVLVSTQAMLVNQKLTPKKPEGTIQDLGLLTEGLFLGFFKEVFPLQDCIKDSGFIINDFEKAYFYLKQGSISDIAEAFSFVASAALKFPHALSECKDVAFVVPEFTKIAVVFSNPITFITKVGSAILWHGIEITSDVWAAVEAWEQRDFFKFGEMIGRIGALTVGKP